MLTMQPIGYVKSPYTSTKEIPKGPGAKHEALAYSGEGERDSGRKPNGIPVGR
jgi:hypothetical protein